MMSASFRALIIDENQTWTHTQGYKRREGTSFCPPSLSPLDHHVRDHISAVRQVTVAASSHGADSHGARTVGQPPSKVAPRSIRCVASLSSSGHALTNIVSLRSPLLYPQSYGATVVDAIDHQLSRVRDGQDDYANQTYATKSPARAHPYVPPW
ncbi:hypothetical protein C8Q72DRAFT_276440 [Fomitopsis betulina]|nr:hypothetical protein C8Q72DRAFT_276440 [Fomitopsis betulina]